MAIQTHALQSIFAVLSPDLAVHPVPVGPTLYPDLDRDFNGFAGHQLVALHSFSEAWPTWERHPAGDEVVVLIEGKADFVLRLEKGDETISLSEPLSYVVVPKGVWHTARNVESAKMLFITPGEGTENVAEPS